MRKSRAWAETTAVSVIIPAALCLGVFSFLWNPAVFLFLFIAAVIAYSHVMFFCHKELGGAFLFLTAVYSAAVQYAVLFAMFRLSGLSGGFSSQEGHPNGDAVLIWVLLFLEPVLINLAALLIRFTVWLFSKE